MKAYTVTFECGSEFHLEEYDEEFAAMSALNYLHVEKNTERKSIRCVVEDNETKKLYWLEIILDEMEVHHFSDPHKDFSSFQAVADGCLSNKGGE